MRVDEDQAHGQGQGHGQGLHACTTSLLYDASTSLVSSPAVCETVRPASQSDCERSMARHVSETMAWSPAYEVESARVAMALSLP